MDKKIDLENLLKQSWKVNELVFLKIKGPSNVLITHFNSDDVFSIQGILADLLIKMKDQAIVFGPEAHQDFEDMLADSESREEFISLFNQLISLDLIKPEK